MENPHQRICADRLLHLKDDDPLLCPISLFRTMDYGRLETAWLRSNAGDREVYRVFLTPDGRTADSNADEWQPMSFLELVRIFRSIYGELRHAPGFHYLRFYLAGVLQDICDVPRYIGENVEDPYSIASYLRSVHDPETEDSSNDAPR